MNVNSSSNRGVVLFVPYKGGEYGGTKEPPPLNLWWPRRDYKTPIERAFRNLPCNVVWIDETAHNLLHQYTSPPEKPSHDDMCAAIWRHNQGFCSCGS